jgi:hypothetical protein
MSLIVTSSSKDPDNVRSQGIGIQSPFSYQNTFRSPLHIKPMSEVAVQSVRCNRQGYSFNHDSYFCIYWGKELSDSESITADHVTNQPIYVKIGAGSYTSQEFRDELQTNLSTTLKKAYPNIIGVTVELNEDSGFTFDLDQIGGHTQILPPDDKWIKAVSSNTRDADGDALDDDIEDSGDFTAVSQVITASASDAHVINTQYPLSLCSGEFSVDPRNASNGGWKIGLTRNLYDPKEGDGTYTLNPKGFVWQNSDAGCDDVDDFYDFVAVWNVGSNLEVFQYIADYDAESSTPDNVGSMVKLTSPVTTITNASLVAGFYDRVKFEFENEIVKLQVREQASTNWVNVINSASGSGPNQLFKPTGLTTQALYPKIYIANKDDNVVVTTYDGINNAGNVFNFYENKLFGLPTSGEANKVLFNCDTNDAFQLDVDGDYDPTYTRLGINASNGQDYKYVFIFAEDTTYNTILDGYLHKNLRDALGFKNNVNKQSVIQDGTSTPIEVVIKSQETPKELGAGSLFIRVNNLPFNSLNGATESISQILYACPRFDTNGNTVGGLYYEPAERTYLALNNTSDYVLSDISVDIVDINERVADDLDGNTIVTLHIRQAKDHHK